MMNKKTKVANFISTFFHYCDEDDGIKPYTIRNKTPRVMKMLDGATHIRIQRGYTVVSFTKEITHVLSWGAYVVIAWNPNEIKIKSLGDDIRQMQETIQDLNIELANANNGSVE